MSIHHEKDDVERDLAQLRAEVAVMAMEAAGKDPTAVKYIPYDAGGKAMVALLSGEIQALSTGRRSSGQ
jgi:tripartite-type tricarboxylate transporter receptor subunit TctC